MLWSTLAAIYKGLLGWEAAILRLMGTPVVP